jgi:hypothetical protein
VEDGGRPLVIPHLITPQPKLTGFSQGLAGVSGGPPRGGGATGDLLIDPGTGQGAIVGGAILEDGSLLGLGPRGLHDNQQIPLHHVVDAVDNQRLLRLRVQPTASSDIRIPVVAGWQSYVALPHGIAVYVGFSPARLQDQSRYPGSTRWLLEYFDDGQPLVWEPIPRSPLRGAYVWRYLCQGLDGYLYLMLAEKGGMRFYRRPGPPAH